MQKRCTREDEQCRTLLVSVNVVTFGVTHWCHVKTRPLQTAMTTIHVRRFSFACVHVCATRALNVISKHWFSTIRAVCGTAYWIFNNCDMYSDRRRRVRWTTARTRSHRADCRYSSRFEYNAHTHVHMFVYVSDKSFEKHNSKWRHYVACTITRVFLNKFRVIPILSQSNIC